MSGRGSNDIIVTSFIHYLVMSCDSCGREVVYRIRELTSMYLGVCEPRAHWLRVRNIAGAPTSGDRVGTFSTSESIQGGQLLSCTAR
jgi:hypothetical protein